MLDRIHSMNQNFTLHPQLAHDTHCLFDLDSFYILLHKNASIPWIIIVPKTNATEIYDLPEDLQKPINAMTKQIAAVFESQFSTEKINIAAIGNIVSQLHIHVIGRKPGDACWPDVVWGADYPNNEYTEEQINSLKFHLIEILSTV